ncbi:hypothetical protein AXG93_872s1350 [Marchantia polymorpha subsp. ruderalis]|uniref:Uncharacterized protein n=1 Tax=Marchantia polymorpha subsp. ruderalis TaxID=1480154 RepID=A0A176VN01_MARPO|nr:hypothetical protein AXG93_872s1350 [Marchantia polymorpha subsp. ruderalis]
MGAGALAEDRWDHVEGTSTRSVESLIWARRRKPGESAFKAEPIQTFGQQSQEKVNLQTRGLIDLRPEGLIGPQCELHAIKANA